MSIFPLDSVATITGAFLALIGANVPIVIGILGFAAGVNFVTKKTNDYGLGAIQRFRKVHRENARLRRRV